MAGKYGIGARVRDEDGDEGVIVGKRKGDRLVRYGGDLLGIEVWVTKSFLTPLAAYDGTPAPAEQEQGEAALVSEDGRIRFTATRFHIAGANNAPDWQPKVGDRVRWKGKDSDFYLHGGEYEITEKSSPVWFLLTDEEGGDHSWDADSLRENFEPLPVAAEAQGADGKAGVTAIFDELEAWLGEDIPVAVAPVTATPTEPKFKVGDRVRRVSNPYDFVPIGYEAVVLEVRDDRVWYRDNDGDRMASHAKDWVLAEPADTPVSADATATPITKGSLVTLARPAQVTGVKGHHVHLLLASGGTYTLPVAALVAA